MSEQPVAPEPAPSETASVEPHSEAARERFAWENKADQLFEVGNFRALGALLAELKPESDAEHVRKALWLSRLRPDAVSQIFVAVCAAVLSVIAFYYFSRK